jgi:SAM-dependent methyltransferase
MVEAALPCPVCGATAHREAGFRDITLYRCPECDHCFTDIASLEHLGEYDPEWESHHENWFANPNLALFDLVADQIDAENPRARVLDIGAGRGELLAYLRQRNAALELTGIDLSLKPSIDGVEILLGDIATLDLGPRQWDVVVSLATIEHVWDVQGFVRRMNELLVPGGLAIVMTPDDRSVLYATARALNRVGWRAPFEQLYERFHLNHFNSKSLRTLIERSGFELLAHHHHNIPLAAVDTPTNSAVLRMGVWGTFVLGRLSGRTYEQTVVARKRRQSSGVGEP